MIEKYPSPIEKWQASFAEQPLDALNRLLIGRAYMGQLDRNDTDEILFRLFHTATKARLSTLDDAMRNWFVTYLKSAPKSIPTSRWSEILRNAFSATLRLSLHKTQIWLLENYVSVRSWLRGLYLSPERDPEADLLRTLALCQRTQALLPLWIRLCRLEEDRPLHFASLGLLGLRKLPDENGEPHGDLHPASFSGVVDLANAIDKQVRQKKEGQTFWFLKVRALMARYPRSSQYWTEHFLPPLSHAPNSLAAKWLGKLIPELKNTLDRKGRGDRIKRQYLQPPSRDEFGTIKKLIEKRPIQEIRDKLSTFLKAHEQYTLQTGFADILVKVFCEIGYRVLNQAPDWALSLVEGAFRWEPYNPYLWTTRAKIEMRIGREERAIGLLWEAKRRFPEDPHIRTDLAELLKKQNKPDTAELVYRQAMADFPQNAVCRNGLAEVLRVQGKLDEAEAIYRQAMADFPQNAYSFVGLAVIGLIQGRKEKSIQLLEKTIKQFPDNQVAKSLLQRIEQNPEDISALVADYDELKAEMVKKAETIKAPIRSLISEGKAIDSSQTTEAIEKKKQKQRLIKEKATSDISDASLSPILETNGNGRSEIQLGLANLYRLAARRAKDSEKELYQHKFIKACDEVLTQNPKNIIMLLEKGFWMLEYDPNNVKNYFKEHLEAAKQPHVLGFRLGYLQTKILQGETVSAKEWQDLISDFPNRKTLINLENARQDLLNINGTTLATLEALRKQLRSNTKVIPDTLRKNEEWIIASIKERLFERIDLGHPITEDILPAVLKNHERNDPILRGIAEQSLTNI